jgi:hypothetical protein
MLRSAAFASSVVASTPTVLPFTCPYQKLHSRTSNVAEASSIAKDDCDWH